jgi:hypothetical protein
MTTAPTRFGSGPLRKGYRRGGSGVNRGAIVSK